MPTQAEVKVKGGLWKTTKDVTVYDAVNFQQYSAGTSRLSKRTDFVSVLPAGTEYRSAGKCWKRDGHVPPNYSLVTMVNISVNGKNYSTELKELTDASEMVSAGPDETIVVIRDTKTGLYYCGGTYYWQLPPKNDSYYDECVKNNADKVKMLYPAKKLDKWHPDSYYKVNKTTGEAVMATTITKAKKFKDVGKAKQRILADGGYFTKVGGPLMIINDNPYHVPDSWVIETRDKKTKALISAFNANESVAATWALIDVVVKFGSSVRNLYKKLESKNQLDDYQGMVIFTASDFEKNPMHDSKVWVELTYDRTKDFTHDGQIHYGLAKVVKDQLKTEIKAQNLDIIADYAANDSIAIAFESIADAVTVKLAIDIPGITATVLDLATLQEVVDEK